MNGFAQEIGFLTRADDEGRTVNHMKSILRHQGVEGTRRRCRNERGECTEEVNNKSEINWK
jgi:hypothetical protein